MEKRCNFKFLFQAAEVDIYLINIFLNSQQLFLELCFNIVPMKQTSIITIMSKCREVKYLA